MKMSFQQWMNKVNQIINAKIGLDSGDLPDCCYLDWYNDGMTAASAATRAVRNCWE